MFANRRMFARGVLGAASLAIVLSACDNDVSGGATPRSHSTDTHQPFSGDPAKLVGSWFVAADGEQPHAILTIGDKVDGGLLLYRLCGKLDGDWRANTHAMFVGDLSGGSGPCFTDNQDPFPPWLTRVTGFRRDGQNELLIGRDGQTVATLTPGAHPHPLTDSIAQFASPPVVTDSMRSDFADPAPLPDGVEPATADDVAGRWVPLPKDRPQQSPGRAFLAFHASGSYQGSDGCNGAGGRYVMGPDGLILAISGPSTLIGCDSSPMVSWPGQSGRIGLRDDHLVFVDPAGKILGEAVRG